MGTQQQLEQELDVLGKRLPGISGESILTKGERRCTTAIGLLESGRNINLFEATRNCSLNDFACVFDRMAVTSKTGATASAVSNRLVDTLKQRIDSGETFQNNELLQTRTRGLIAWMGKKGTVLGSKLTDYLTWDGNEKVYQALSDIGFAKVMPSKEGPMRLDGETASQLRALETLKS